MSAWDTARGFEKTLKILASSHCELARGKFHQAQIALTFGHIVTKLANR